MKTKILVVGQTPPPIGGQAVLIKLLLDARYEHAELFHVRMAFSQEMDEIGRVKTAKFWRLLRLIGAIISTKLKHQARVLYYPPAGPNRVPFYRDVVILMATRWMFKKVIFHFHAGGVSDLYPALNPVEKWLFRRAYFYPDLAIRASPLNPEDGRFMRARQETIIPCGLPDEGARYSLTRTDGPRARVLLAGVLSESKGILVALEALRELVRRGLPCDLEFIGKWESPEFERRVRDYLVGAGLGERVNFLGVQSGADKWKIFERNGIFCFPSFFESETFGLVLLEAMQFAMPVVATRWRGIPSVVSDGETGFLVPIKDSAALADGLARLLTDHRLAEAMGRRGREKYLREFTADRFCSAWDRIFKEMGTSTDAQ
jgi:glycosyltransferase involved in cell wall biosynthesis